MISAPSYTNQDWQLGYDSLLTEYDYWIEDVEGQIPLDLKGTLFRNGPGRLERGGSPYRHPFDGDGMITRISFIEGKAHFSNRYIQTPEFQEEEKVDRILYRNAFGTQKPGGWWNNIFDLKIKNPVNVQAIYHGGKLLALWDGDLPYRLDPYTLATQGKETFGEKLKLGQPFTPHPRLDPKTGTLMAFGVEAGLNSILHLYEIDAHGNLHTKKDYPIPGFAFLHDFLWTPHYKVFFQNPLSFNPLPFMLGLQTPGMCFHSDLNSPTRILILDDQGEAITIDTHSGFAFHHVNGFEQTDPDTQEPHLILDSVVYESYPSFDGKTDYRLVDFATVPPGKLRRFRINLAQKTVESSILLDRSVEFPAIHPGYVGSEHRYVYLATVHQGSGSAPLQGITKLDTHTHQSQIHSFAPFGFVGEPIFVPSGSEEDEGWLLSLVFDAEKRRSKVVILSAQSMQPIAQLLLKTHVPYGFHGSFTSEVFLDPE